MIPALQRFWGGGTTDSSVVAYLPASSDNNNREEDDGCGAMSFSSPAPPPTYDECTRGDSLPLSLWAQNGCLASSRVDELMHDVLDFYRASNVPHRAFPGLDSY